ncbi:PorT family protein [Panacibacter ginsenosidivorans]|uniref:PorT family protein n=1 Tax=Panacibacter ginsenosidivorans TaxID=1813871 RepID=A0A5B8V9P6_9BACT|nr:porin family protein [Panacibacter ginsenosidivorans]QEC67581.1 PorT family protein [Panacibacter ginsenosidivorans]
MKRIAFCLLFFYLFGNLCSGQSSLRLGIKGGISIPNLKSSSDNPVSKGWSSRQGPYFGAVIEMGINKRLYVQAELNYSSQGGKKNGTQAIASAPYANFFPPGTTVPDYFYAKYNNEAKLNYLELPVLLKFYFPFGENFSFFVTGGPYVAYLLGAKDVTNGLSNVYFNDQFAEPVLPAAISFDATSDVQGNIKNFNIGIQGGIGFACNIFDKNNLFFSAGGNYGLIPIQKDKINGKSNTGAATITLGYLIVL